jgi:predicted hydrocarbon binding protein
MIPDLLRKYFSLKQIREEDGLIVGFSQVLVLMPAQTLLDLEQEIAKKLGCETARTILIEAGKKRVKQSASYLKLIKNIFLAFEKLPFGSPLIQLASEAWKVCGWGEYSIIKLGKSKILVKTKTSPLARSQLNVYGRSEKPVCSYICGMLAGGAEAVYGEKFNCKETSCTATGKSNECIFELIKAR